MQFAIRDFLQVPPGERKLDWLQRTLQAAVQLEFATIPPYLAALWSIRDPDHMVAESLSRVVLQEMLHMGFACNLLTAIGGTPQIDKPTVVPTYPGPLPGEVHPGLVVPLQRMSKRLVERVFMKIEEPESGPVTWYRGMSYPTIGAFYSAVYDGFKHLKPPTTGVRQRTTTHGIRLTKITSLDEALQAVTLIKEQGEGTAASPYYGPSAADLAHYYRFGEVFHGRRIMKVNGGWAYAGDRVPFPTGGELFPMAPIPPGGYPEQSATFDRAYSAVLHDLQAAWELDQQDRLNRAILAMKDGLPRLARDLMGTQISPSRPNTVQPKMTTP